MAMQNIILVSLALILVFTEALTVRGGQAYTGDEYPDEMMDLLDKEETRKVERDSSTNEGGTRGPHKSRKLICFTSKDIGVSDNEVDKRFMRFGKRESLHKLSDYSYEDDSTQAALSDSPDKRFLRFGKRFMRFGKRFQSTKEPKMYCLWL